MGAVEVPVNGASGAIEGGGGCGRGCGGCAFALSQPTLPAEPFFVHVDTAETKTTQNDASGTNVVADIATDTLTDLGGDW